MDDLPGTYFWNRSHNPMADRFNEWIQKGLEKIWETETPCRTRENYAYAAALFFFSSYAGYRHIPYQIKYGGNKALGRFFGKMLGERLRESGLFDDTDLVIPVPLHWTRRWKRGYNQAELIAESIAGSLGAELRTDILRRTKRTQTQTALEIEDKARNVDNAFRARHTPEGYRHILLVDDIFTTGSTLYACFTALRAVFPSSVRISVATLGFVGGV